MTVQEVKAKEILNNIWDFADAQDEEKGDVVDDAIIEVIGCMEEVEQYRALGTVEELKEAREKQVAKKPIDIMNLIIDEVDGIEIGSCSVCEMELFKGQSYCSNCGTKIDWSEEND